MKGGGLQPHAALPPVGAVPHPRVRACPYGTLVKVRALMCGWIVALHHSAPTAERSVHIR